MKKLNILIITVVFMIPGLAQAGGNPPPPPPPSEPALGDCANYSALRNPYFGDLHIHTSFSLDARQFGNRTQPIDAYNFAKGAPIGLPPYDTYGRPTRQAQLDRPLDFAGVTDHSEFLAETSVCYDGGTTAYYSTWCVLVRQGGSGLSTDLLAFALGLGGMSTPNGWESMLCRLRPGLCNNRIDDVWKKTQDQADAAYDRSSNCSFTAFVGYEYTGTPLLNNWHRNVIFRDEKVLDQPIGYIDAPSQELLWELLDSGCNNNPNGCEVLTIPHNSNLGGGAMFVPYTDDGFAYSPQVSSLRQKMEPLLEIYQHKGSSECMTGSNSPLASEDEPCAFELLVPDICTGSPNDSPNCKPLCSDKLVAAGGIIGACVEPSDFARGALRNGLVEQLRTGVNPFKFGFIGSTDTHNSTPGSASEKKFDGHMASNDDTAAEKLSDDPLFTLPDGPLGDLLDGVAAIGNQRFSPGGLAVVWAEQNSRHVLFDAMRRRETYATSGTRIISRFFGGWDYPQSLCSKTDFVERGYNQGVPMGGDLPPRPWWASAPRFAISAQMDLGTAGEPGTQLQRVQVVKGWLEGGATHEQVYDVAGNANNGAGVDVTTCQTYGSGEPQLCTVWTDPDFDPAEPAFYYVRVLENPTCRWNRRLCNEQQVQCAGMGPDDPMIACCDGSIPDTIQERAWTSPIWYTP